MRYIIIYMYEGNLYKTKYDTIDECEHFRENECYDDMYIVEGKVVG